MKHFLQYKRRDIMSLTNIRRFVTRIGERIQVSHDKADITDAIAGSDARYVLFGIPEDIGILANGGIGGAHTAWKPFLSAFLNLQSNDFFSGEEVFLAGCFDFNDMKFLIEENAYDEQEKTNAYRHAVITIDEEVEQLSKLIVSQGKIPIAIGGGHNNAYPLIKGVSKGLYHAGKIPLAQINVINLDAHTDYRPSEGRHSGNGFRYADEDGFLLKYCVIGVHENHVPQNVLNDFIKNPFLEILSFEDIFIYEKRNFQQALAHAVLFTDDNYTGIELDLDAVGHTLSSAMTPSGVTSLHARQYMHYTAERSKAAYLHICEGAAELSDGRTSSTTGKLISYLVSDFIKGANP